MATLLLAVACQALQPLSAVTQATVVPTAMTPPTPTGIQIVPTETSPSLSHTLSPTVSIAPALIIPNESNIHIVFTYRARDSIGCTNDLIWDPGCFGIPDLLIYENGLVLFTCHDEEWPKICQNNISSERIAHLLNDLAAADFFGEYRNYSANVGPHVSFQVEVSTKEMHGGMRWSSNSSYLSPVPESVSLVEKTIQTFFDQVQEGSQLYRPEYAMILARGCQCPPPPNATWGEEGGYVNDLYNFCDDLESFPEWPFEFDSPNELLTSWNVLMSLQPVSVIAPVISDMTCVPSCTPTCQYKCSFRNGDIFLSIQMRPYLPGEAIEADHSRDQWIDWGEVTLTLQCYPSPDLPMTYPTPLPSFTAVPRHTPTYP